MITQPATKNASTPIKPIAIPVKQSCPTLSGAGTIAYELSSSDSTGLQARLDSNSGSGNFGKELINLNDAVDLLTAHAETHPINA